MKNAESGTSGEAASREPPACLSSFSILHSSLSSGVVVLGLGNPLRGDDGAGLKVAEAVDARLREQPVPGVTVRTSTRAGLEVIDLLSGFGRAIVVDCLEVPDAVPGRVRRLALDGCPGSARLVGAHDVSLRDAFAFARATGYPMPDEVDVYGVEAAETLAITEGLSPAVAAAVEALAEQIHEELFQRTADHGYPSGQLTADPNPST
jgi:hydrogenase maturation protease